MSRKSLTVKMTKRKSFSTDIEQVREKPCIHLEKRNFRQREQQVQRPWGRSVLGVFREHCVSWRLSGMGEGDGSRKTGLRSGRTLYVKVRTLYSEMGVLGGL